MSLSRDVAAYIFDLDGTLLDTEPLYTEAGQAVLEPFGKVFDPALKRRTMGGDSRTSAGIIIQHYGLPLTVEEFLSQRQEILLKLFPDAPEIRGAGAMLARLRGQAARLGLATSSHQDVCDLKLASREWADCFDVVICGDDPRLSRSKPDPQIFLLCAEELAAPPSSCLVFEDSPIGIRAATAAGMTVVAIASPHVARSDLSEASLIVEDLDDALHQLSL